MVDVVNFGSGSGDISVLSSLRQELFALCACQQKQSDEDKNSLLGILLFLFHATSNKCHASSNRCLTSSNNVCY